MTEPLTSKVITLIGYYGAGNPGDDCLERQSVSLIKEYAPNATCHHHQSNHKILTVFLILKSDTIIFGGGSLFQDHTSQKSLYYYLALLAIALLLRKKTILLGHGFSPFQYSLSKKIAAFLLKKTHKITVRDKESFTYCKKLNIPEHKLHLASDLAYYKATITSCPDQPLVIASRYHVCVWASLHQIPFLALAYDDKLINLATVLHQPYIDTRNPYTQHDFQEKVSDLQNKFTHYQNQLKHHVPRLIQRAENNKLS